MKVMTVLGTRPEIIRLSRIIPHLDAICDHVLVHTGQNYTANLSDVFFHQMGIRQPDHYLGVRGESIGEIVAGVLVGVERALRTERPDCLLILGDTNSALSAVIAKRMGIPVFHMEAGNRCYDDRVPEEVNRRVIDHCSDVLMPYTERSRANLLREGIPGHRIFVTGNPIKEVLDYYAPQIEASDVLADFAVEPDKYLLVTLHRAENVDNAERLDQFIAALRAVSEAYHLPILCSLHPRTRSRLEQHARTLETDGIRTFDPVGFFDFIHLERSALCVLSDSGTVQEECCIFGIPNVTIRDVTERPETIEVGSNILSGATPEIVLRCVQIALSRPPIWTPPPEYVVPIVSQAVVKIVLGYPGMLKHAH
jgi:UDP-N-acetylglucosamine 2-epimerase (non-hydrolysing)